MVYGVLVFGVLAIASAIFFMFWAVAAKRHCILTTVSREPSEPGIPMSMELLGVRKGSLDGFLAAFVELLAPIRKAIAVSTLSGILPDMAGDGLLMFSV